MRLFVAACLLATTAASAQMKVTAVSPTALAYPNTDRQDVVEDHFGIKVADPYRWLENDVRQDQKVREWVTAQNNVTQAYLATLPARDLFKARIKALFDYERFGVPQKKGSRYFYQHNSGLQNQSPLYVRETLDGPARLLIDPNAWAEDGATALAEWEPSEDGRYVAYGVQDGGTDWRTVKVLDVATGQPTADTVEWVKFSGLAWAKDGSGFYYSRFPKPEGAQFQALNENHVIYFHRLGTPQSADVRIYATPEHPKWNNTAEVSDDGRWLIVTSSEGTDDRYEITVIDLTSADRKPRTLFKGLENNWQYAGNSGATFFFLTNRDAPRQRLVSVDVNAATPVLREIVPQDKATLESASLVGDEIVATYLVDAKSEVRRYTTGGQLKGKLSLPGIGTASGFQGKAGDAETFFSFTSFATPTTIYRYDAKTGATAIWAQPKVAFNPEDFRVEQRFYASKDGTRVPIFIVRRNDVTGPAPTLLYGYGGFNVSLPPAFSAARLAWVQAGGVFALANIRGGGEYGKEWHDAGRLKNKQNVFDDFIAAGEYLKKEGITGPDQLAIQGGSNGGLLVGAVVNQRPDLFAAALPAVGVMDMTRFDRFTAGRYWVDDYGYPSKEADFRTLWAYSPYHNVKSGREYPAILVTTADTDDRVVPGHSFKYAAMLQANQLGAKPHLIRIETRAGHGSGKPTDKIIEETADQWAFIAKWTGLEVK